MLEGPGRDKDLEEVEGKGAASDDGINDLG